MITRSAEFERAVKRLLKIEGGYSDHPADSGGATRWGVTEFLARAHGYRGDMRDYPVAMALDVYHAEFWTRLRLDDIAILSPAIAYELFDTEVNTPAGTAPVFLQRLLNALNDGGRRYPDLKVDGRIGPVTIAALHTFLMRRDAPRVLLTGLNALQGAYYVGLAERRQKDEAFMFGWLAQRVHI